MKALQIKGPYQAQSPYFGIRNGKLYSGPFALDGTPVSNAGSIWQGQGVLSPLRNMSAHALDITNLRLHTGVEASVRQRSLRIGTAIPSYNPLLVKGFEDTSYHRMRSGTIPSNDQGIAEFTPMAAGTHTDAGVNTNVYPQQRLDAFMAIQDLGAWSGVANYGSSRTMVKTSNSNYVIGVIDILPIEGNSRLLTYCMLGSGFFPRFGGGGRLHTCDRVPETGAYPVTSAFVKAMCWSNVNAGHATYAVPLEKSLVEYDVNGAATHYHMFYPTALNGNTVPGELRYKKVQLRPTVVEPDDAESILIENVTSGGWLPANGSQSGYLAVQLETRPFIYEHEGVRYLTIVIKRGVNKPASADYEFTIKRAVLTDGVPGAFETFTFPELFPDYGNALVLSPDRKHLWFYAYSTPKIACFTMGENITLDQTDFATSQYITSVGVENGLCMVMTDQFEKYVLVPSSQPAAQFTLAFDKAVYAIGETAQLTVTTTAASVLAEIEVLGASVREHTIEVTAAQPAVVNLTVTGRLQATVVDWI